MNRKSSTGNVAFQVAVLAVAFCAATVFGAAQKPQPPYEATAVGKLESRTKDKTRCPGIFGDYWWANRFLDRHQEVEKLKGRTVDLVLLGDSIRGNYQQAVKDELANEARVYHPSENCRFTSYTLHLLRHWLPAVPKPDVVHWNNGIWEHHRNLDDL